MQTLVHDKTKLQLDGIRPQTAGSYIFHGPRHVGKATAAREVVRLLNCIGDDNGLCSNCHLTTTNAFPDMIIIEPQDRPTITIAQVRELIQNLSYSLYNPTSTRVVIIDDASTLTLDAQNALLKLIEEPPTSTIFILVTNELESLLPTMRSRCRAIYFPKLPISKIETLVQATIGNSQPGLLAKVAAGLPGTAIALASNSETANTRLQLAQTVTTLLTKGVFERLMTAKQLIDQDTDFDLFQTMLHEEVITSMGSNSTTQLVALEIFSKQLHAKVSPRIALERLMVAM